MLLEVMKKDHVGMYELGVKIGVYFAISPDGENVTEQGYAVIGKIKSLGLLDRMKTSEDAELIIDSDWWTSANEKSKYAALDYFLTSLKLVANTERAIEEGEPPYKEDDIGRPLLKKRKGDWNAGVGFNDVIKRHGSASVEYFNLKQCLIQAESAVKEHDAAI
jgi:hypothetical protein